MYQLSEINEKIKFVRKNKEKNRLKKKSKRKSVFRNELISNYKNKCLKLYNIFHKIQHSFEIKSNL